jgi:hypothetical protein
MIPTVETSAPEPDPMTIQPVIEEAVKPPASDIEIAESVTEFQIEPIASVFESESEDIETPETEPTSRTEIRLEDNDDGAEN